MASTNPIFSDFTPSEHWSGHQAASSERMSLSGVLHKTAILLALFTASAACSWIEVGLFQHRGKSTALVLVLVFLAISLGGFILVRITVSMKQRSPITAPIYALLQGSVVGALSVGMDQRYPGIAIRAVGLTIAICFCLLGAYRFGLIKVTESFNKKLAVALSGVIIYYLVSFALAVTGGHTISMITGGMLGILISMIIVVIAGMGLISNFDLAAQCSKERFPKYMEWYAAMGLLIALVWLYLETLDLLSKSRKAAGQ